MVDFFIDLFEAINPFHTDKRISVKKRFRRNPNVDFKAFMADRKNDVEVYRVLLKEWNTMCVLGQYEEIEDLMRNVDFKNANTTSMMGLCRATFSDRWAIPYWWDYVDRVVEEIKNRGEDYEDIMNGLVDRRKMDNK